MRVPGASVTSVQQLLSNSDLTVLLASLKVDTMVHPCGAVIGNSENRELINTGSYVEFCAGPDQVNIIMVLIINISANVKCHSSSQYFDLVHVCA